MKAFEVIQAHKRRQVARLLSLVVCVAVWSNLIFEVSTTSDYWWLLALIGVFVFYLSVMISEISSARPAALDSPAHQVSAIASPNVPSESLLEERFLLITTKARGELGAEKASRLQDLDRQLHEIGLRQADEFDQSYQQTPAGKLDASLSRLEDYIATLKTRAG